MRSGLRRRSFWLTVSVRRAVSSIVLPGVEPAPPALGGPRVEAEEVRLRLRDHPAAVLLVEGEADGDHAHLLRHPEHVDLVLQGDAGLGQHLVDLAVLVDVADRRPDVGDRAHPHALQVLEHQHHVLQGVVGVEAGAHEGAAREGGQDVFSRVVEGLPVRVEDGPEHRHRAHPVGAQPRPGEGVDAVDPRGFEQLRTSPLAALAMNTGTRLSTLARSLPRISVRDVRFTIMGAS